MPEEILIIVIVIVVLFALASWVIREGVRTLSAAVDAAHTNVSSFLGTVRLRILQKNRARLAAHVSIVIPDELKTARAQLQSLQKEFDEHCRSSTWSPERPTWEKIRFEPHLFNPQGPASLYLNIGDIRAILRPDPSSWRQIERGLLSCRCSYPSTFKLPYLQSPRELVPAPFSLEPAAFKVKDDVRGAIYIKRLFRKEANGVAAYNLQRNELLSQHERLANQILTWNEEEHQRSIKYEEVSHKLAIASAALFHGYASQYEADCTRQTAQLTQVFEGIVRKPNHRSSRE